ncbi:hemerythrin domain-containing protein [Profundibacterium mesophilum]|uniref:Hemerythrin HHE cation binding domain containing protein n=1 Tax=Profundibacterium mesophilum KAUST100406-0324 TaxID=1037889 RepID=A0A921NXN7_9RHOB|nr:hemerythrin domain-containing protein [Profundibacterium mesophilum]KAF0676629.1 Hemerythrin HHE cation binding domain containing protein [Profundibacterium mesophilum KAUST100406-0324]
MPSIYDAIKKDHDDHRALLETISGSESGSEARRTAWEKFYYDVKSHAAAEEETFYSKLISKTWGQDSARHSVHEHQQLDDLMEELNEMDMGAPQWIEKFKTLRHDYEHHIDEEEDEVFTRAREVIEEKEIEGYGTRFLERKKEERKLVDEKREDSLED